MSRPLKQSVSVVIRNPADPSQVLIVLRPPHDDDLPNVWGLPAGSLRPGESWEEVVRRVGLEKLGVQLKAGAELERGTTERRDYRLEMRLFEAEIEKGHPFVPQPDVEHTQYTTWKWGTTADLEPAAQRGSLCCRLYLKAAAG